MGRWIYKNSDDNKLRFILGEKGGNTLICIGINPSTAEPDKLDNTLRNVRSRVLALGYDSWIMINVYAQRATDPDNLDATLDTDAHRANLYEIKNLFRHRNYDIWASWGTLIGKRKYLLKCLEDISEAIGDSSKWFTIGKLSKDGHPHHPLYLRKNLPVRNFSIMNYLNRQ